MNEKFRKHKSISNCISILLILYLTLGSLLPNNIYAQDLQSYSGKVCNTTYKAPIERSEGFFKDKEKAKE
ncbi:hypothetical protein KK424_04985 [Clostridioides difficile]|nr:hypothetical protein [Clostridioides difficile]MBT2159035.1 hypothetical protein [Clostridioides difficile]